MLKIALDSGPLTGGHSVRGIGFMVREQIKALRSLTGVRKNKFQIDYFDFNSGTGKDKLVNNNYDIVHYTSFFPYAETLPSQKLGKRVIVTIQDLIHLIYPDKYPPGIRGNINLYRQKLRLKLVDEIITISETSKKDIVRLLGVKPENVKVIYLAPSAIYKKITNKKMLNNIKRKYKLPEKFVFNLGDVNYNKNILTLIDACEMAKIPLVLGGKQAKEIENMDLINLMSLSGPKDWLRFLFNIPHPENAHYEKLLEKFHNSKNIIRLGYIPDEDISAVYSLAAVYCQPSYYEGFGLSVVHSFACGIPVVVAKTNCLVEIAGDAALIADPNSAKDIADKLIKVVRNKKIQNDLITKGRKRLKYFSWYKYANQLADVYSAVTTEK